MTASASTDTSYPRLLADVGGTNVRFALETAPMQIGTVTALKVADHSSLEAAMRHYLDGLRAAGTVLPHHAAIGLANPVTATMFGSPTMTGPSRWKPRGRRWGCRRC